MTASDLQLKPLGDAGLLLELPEAISPAIHRRCMALKDAIKERWIEEGGPDRFIEVVPAYRSLAVYFDADVADFREVEAFVRRVIASWGDTAGRQAQARQRRWYIPVVYGGECGPDLGAVAVTLGCTEDDVIRHHSAAVYRLYMYGFAPGHASLAENPPPLCIGRRNQPRAVVEQGAVGIGGLQCGVYSLAGPGGLHIIGRTAVRLFFPEKVPPTPMTVGDEVQFRRVESLAAAGHLDCSTPAAP